MIDTHIHVVRPRLPGVGSLDPILNQPVERIADALRSQMADAGITHALAMGALSSHPEDPLGVADTLRIAGRVPGLHAIGIMNPQLHDDEHLRRVESELVRGRVVAFKAYLGYLHYAPDYVGYRPYYELAGRFGLPVIFHTGDTYSPYAKLRYARPLNVDDVAVDHPEVKFVVAHVGNPWMLDAAEVVYKNVNVWTDLSGLWIGETEHPEQRTDAQADIARRLGEAFRYAERPNRFLYGSDWPLVGMKPYREFIQSVIPTTFHEQVFDENARMLFRIPPEPGMIVS